ncbi:Uncharacterised protein [Mycobacteroides abscessus subsp. massiliense]|nr:Uncharacterised protein [Mycobacteroides abscessus subsp. massiliense]
MLDSNVHRLVGRHLRHGRVQIDIGQPVLRHGDPQLQARDRVVGDATDQVDIDPQRGELAGHRTERAGSYRPPQHHDGVRRRILDHRTVPAEFDVDVEPEGVHGLFELVLQRFDRIAAALRLHQHTEGQLAANDNLFDVQQVDAVAGQHPHEYRGDAGLVGPSDGDKNRDAVIHNRVPRPY